MKDRLDLINNTQSVGRPNWLPISLARKDVAEYTSTLYVWGWVIGFSRRITSVQPSPTLALNTKAIQLRVQGHKVLNFAVGEPDYPTPQVVVDRANESLKAGRTKYTPAGGGPELRQAIADKLQRDNGLTYNVNQIVVGAGAKEVLFHTFLSLLNDGDEVLLTGPYWVSYGDQIRAAGGVPVTVPIPDHGGFPSLETVE